MVPVITPAWASLITDIDDVSAITAGAPEKQFPFIFRKRF